MIKKELKDKIKNQAVVVRKKTKTLAKQAWDMLPKEMHQAVAYINSFMFADTLEKSAFQQEIKEELHRQVKPAVKFGIMAILAFVAFFVIWGGLAPLDSASVGHGHIALSGNHKTIQHLYGGIVEKILVKEGDLVQEGQILMELNYTSQKAKVASIKSQLWTARAMEIRLLAERNYETELKFEDPLFDEKTPDLEQILKTQESYFVARTSLLNDTNSALTRKIQQEKERINGLEHQKEAYAKRRALLDAEAERVNELQKKGLVSNQRFFEMQRQSAEVMGQEAAIGAQILEVKERILEIEIDMLRQRDDFITKVEAELREVQEKLFTLREQLEAEQDILDRTIIRAPSAGIVHGLQHFTIGGVIAPGSKIMDIVPQNDKLIVEARISPRDIESVKVGLTARIQLGAFKTRLVPRIDGKVIYVSADRFVDDPRSGMMAASSDQPSRPGEAAYYLIKIELDEESISRINTEIKLHPGMPADVFIVKGTRTFLQYLISPIVDSFHRAFKEA
jgi:HlyD family type I secretion membrane fusion protein